MTELSKLKAILKRVSFFLMTITLLCLNSFADNSLLARVETVRDNKKERSLDYMSVRNYCQNLFEFQTITIRKFK